MPGWNGRTHRRNARREELRTGVRPIAKVPFPEEQQDHSLIPHYKPPQHQGYKKENYTPDEDSLAPTYKELKFLKRKTGLMRQPLARNLAPHRVKGLPPEAKVKPARVAANHGIYRHKRSETHLLIDLFPNDCYITRRFYGNAASPFFLVNAGYDDIVARYENALLAGMQIPETFTDQDMYMAWIPTRRVLAFGYAVLLPHIGDRVKAACNAAQIPVTTLTDEIYRIPENMHFLSQLWRERVTARSGLVYIYAEKYARKGSPQHLKIHGELTKQIAQQEEKHDHKHLHFTIPQGGTPEVRALPGPVVDAFVDDPR